MGLFGVYPYRLDVHVLLFMFMKQLRNAKFHFSSYHWPQWPISRVAAVPQKSPSG
jgi:hypothetical protein